MPNRDDIQRRIDELFAQASELPREDESAFLDEACQRESPEVRQEVERMLRAAAATPLEPRPFPGFQQGLKVTPQDPLLNREIGKYTLRRRLGQGGFGTVYLAERTDEYQQKAAVKLIRSDHVTNDRVIQRFELERQTLADLHHENIAQLLDGGTTAEGWPYFVMEYVEGESITDYCDAKRMSVEDRLHLFQKVCAVVKYAHDFGYIHRDIKPSNILVTSEGVPKLLDFGIAKLIDPRSRSRLVSITEEGMPGTPEYASPEQIRGDRKEISTATDVYSLGVLLYELLTGHPPYDFQSYLIDEMRRVICEEAPQKPSTVVLKPIERVTDHGKETITPDQIGERRQAEPQRLGKTLRGDLETILLKALHKDRQRRYDSPASFAGDIENYRQGLPVKARPDSVLYRATKFVKRNCRAVLAGAVVLISLLVATIVSTAFWLRADRLAEREQIAKEDALAKGRQLEQQVKTNKQLATSESHAKHEVMKQLSVATQLRLIGESKSIQEASPVRSLLLKVEAAETALRNDHAVIPAVHQALIESVPADFRPPLKHRGTINSIAISPDSKLLAVGSVSDEVRIWKLTATSVAFTSISLKGHDDEVCSLTFSSDSTLLAVGAYDGFVRVWDLSDIEAPKLLHVLGRHRGPVRQIAFDSSGRWLASGNSKANRFPNPFTREPQKAKQNADVPKSAEEKEFSIRLWDLNSAQPKATGRVLASWEGAFAQGSQSLIFSPDGNTLATAIGESALKLWNLSTNPPVAKELDFWSETPDISRSEIAQITFSSDGRWLVAAGRTRMKAWELDPPESVNAPLLFKGVQSSIDAIAISEGGSIVACGAGKEALVWDRSRSELSSSPIRLRGHSGDVWSISLTRDGRWLTTGSSDNTVRLWDLKAEDPSATPKVLRGHDSYISAQLISPDERFVITADGEGFVRVWDMPQHAGRPGDYVLTAPPSSVSASSRSPSTPMPYSPSTALEQIGLLSMFFEGQRLVGVPVPAKGECLAFWKLGDSLATTEMRTADGHEVFISAAAASPNGRWIVSAGPKKIFRWDATADDPRKARKEIRRSSANRSDTPLLTGTVETMAVGPTGRWVAWAEDHQYTTRLVNCGSEMEEDAYFELAGHRSKIITMAISHDGHWLVTTSRDSTRLWDLSASDPTKRVVELTGHKREVVLAKFAPSGKWLATGSVDGTARLWSLDSATLGRSTELPLSNRRGFSCDVLAFDSSGHLLFTGISPEMGFPNNSLSTPNLSRIWKLANGAATLDRRTLTGLGYVRSACFSADGRWLATGEHDRVSLWNLSDRDLARTVVRFHVPGGDVRWIGFIHGGRWLATLSDSGRVQLWDYDLQSLCQNARKFAGRNLTSAERSCHYLE